MSPRGDLLLTCTDAATCPLTCGFVFADNPDGSQRLTACGGLFADNDYRHRRKGTSWSSGIPIYMGVEEGEDVWIEGIAHSEFVSKHDARSSNTTLLKDARTLARAGRAHD
jgi:hypothetical protein